MQEYKPFLMSDDSKKDGHAETIMDYVLSWCLRCTNYRYVKDHQPILYQYCAYMLFKLIDKELDLDYTSIDRVCVKKQEQGIDLWVEVELTKDKKTETHAILIEDKYYSPLGENQLETYKPNFDAVYKDRSDIHRHYAVITCLYRDNKNFPPLELKAQENGFDAYFVYDLLDPSLNGQESESDIFNEFFIREWL